MQNSESQKRGIPRGVWALGFVSMLMDVSSEMVHGLLPVFLVTVLSASYTTVGFIEGFGEATAVALKVISGPLSDWFGKRKPLVLLGYAMGAVSKPLFALATSSQLVLGARLFDRVGKGIRGAPRDALIADLTPKQIRGAAFGLRQSLDTLGAILGPLIAIALMHFSQQNFRLVFWLALVPGLLCVLLILVGVREPEQPASHAERRRFLPPMSRFPFSFWLVAAAGGVSQLSRFSEAFLILRTTDFGLSIGYTPVVLIAMNVIYSAAAYPVGWLSDRTRKETIVVFGFVIMAVADALLALSKDVTTTFLGIALWGLHLAFTQGTLAALVADHSPVEHRGAAFGIFNLFTAVALLIASATAGVLWDTYGPATTFWCGAVFALLGALLIPVASRIWKLKAKT